MGSAQPVTSRKEVSSATRGVGECHKGHVACEESEDTMEIKTHLRSYPQGYQIAFGEGRGD